MTANRPNPVRSARGPASCPHCRVTLTKSEAKREKCPTCKKTLAETSSVQANYEPESAECPNCQEPLQRKQVECVVCGRCGGLGPKYGDGTADCSKCQENYQLMELSASVCESCGWMAIEQRGVRLRRLWQFLAAVIFIAAVILPALEAWSPKFSSWVLEKFGITIPFVARLVPAAVGGAIAAAIWTPQRRFRKFGEICGVLGGLGAFGLSWSYIRMMVWIQVESATRHEIRFATLLYMAPVYLLFQVLLLLYEELVRRQRNSENANNRRTVN